MASNLHNFSGVYYLQKFNQSVNINNFRQLREYAALRTFPFNAPIGTITDG